MKAKDDEIVVFAWIEWPDKATRDAGIKKMREHAAADERWDAEKHPPPFDGKRMVRGGFTPVVDICFIHSPQGAPMTKKLHAVSSRHVLHVFNACLRESNEIDIDQIEFFIGDGLRDLKRGNFTAVNQRPPMRNDALRRVHTGE